MFYRMFITKITAFRITKNLFVKIKTIYPSLYTMIHQLAILVVIQEKNMCAMTNSNIIPLNIHPRPRPKKLKPVIPGRKYFVSNPSIVDDTPGLCENFIATDKAGYLQPASHESAGFFLWDLDCELQPNHVELVDANSEPVVYQSQQQ